MGEDEVKPLLQCVQRFNYKPPIKLRKKSSAQEVPPHPLDNIQNKSNPRYMRSSYKKLVETSLSGTGKNQVLPLLMHHNRSNESYGPGGYRAASREGSINDFSPQPTELMNIDGTSFISQRSILSKLAATHRHSSSSVSVFLSCIKKR